MISCYINNNNINSNNINSNNNNVDNIEIEAYKRWNGIPCTPTNPTCAGRIVNLVSYVQGKLKNTPLHFEEILNLTSLLRWMPSYEGEIGEEIRKTIDLNTHAGYALLVHPDKDIVDIDYTKILELQPTIYDVI